ncbi:hypothetical protein M6B38_371330 [Iris pallida]|uniref:Secreted protein n=1 Tax=Iris pallida TaxID=29817 RepID=A0AAX6EII2_IRIPA|nr:hypothetical protein M6B38_189870 [Iris pallida]KAJ6826683.1 hypothetical protein M6B38_371330 [Iris pallida]
MKNLLVVINYFRVRFMCCVRVWNGVDSCSSGVRIQGWIEVTVVWARVDFRSCPVLDWCPILIVVLKSHLRPDLAVAQEKGNRGLIDLYLVSLVSLQ